MRVFYSMRYLPFDVRAGGGEVIAWNTMLGLAREGCELDVFVEGEGCCGLEVEGVRFHFLGPSKFLGMFFQLFSFLRGGFDVVHGCDGKLLLVNIFCRYFSRIPCVFEVHTAEFKGRGFVELVHGFGLPALRRFIFFRKERLCARFASKLVVLSRFSCGDVARAYGVAREDMVIIPPGVDVSVYRPEAIEKRGERLITVARLEPVKNIGLLLRAFQKLEKRFSGLRLDVVGEGSLKPHFEALCEEWGLEGAVVFHGFLKPRAIARLLNRASVFVLPSLSESFGMVNAEAMACGLPVVSSRVGAVGEVVEDGVNGFLVNPLDDGEIVDAVSVLLQDAGLRSVMGERNVKKVREHYTWESRVERVVRLYRGLAGV